MTKVQDLKPGTLFRINAKRYELLKCGVGSAYVKELGTERRIIVEGDEGDRQEFKGGAKKYTIAPTAEVDEVIS